MSSTGYVRTRSAKVIFSALMTLGAITMTGCVGIMPNSATEEGRKKVSEVHSVVYTVKAPFGTKITYTDGANTATGTTNNLGEWVETVDVTGIVGVSITVDESAGDSATCLITVDGTQVAMGMSKCKGSTSKT